jgi:hypothetical protein
MGQGTHVDLYSACAAAVSDAIIGSHRGPPAAEFAVTRKTGEFCSRCARIAENNNNNNKYLCNEAFRLPSLFFRLHQR